MNELLKGVLHFKANDFKKLSRHFIGLGRKQNPHTLFIGCADSRIVPNLITNTLPGELFTVRNVGNLVPPYRKTAEYVATTSAIEYACTILKVSNIVVCGHSNCGACTALWDKDSLAEAPLTQKWLELAEPVKARVLRHFRKGAVDFARREWLTEQYNVVEQVNHLLTYPFIQNALDKGQVTVQGWYYVIETGEVYVYNSQNETFDKVEPLA